MDYFKDKDKLVELEPSRIQELLDARPIYTLMLFELAVLLSDAYGRIADLTQRVESLEAAAIGRMTDVDDLAGRIHKLDERSAKGLDMLAGRLNNLEWLHP